MFTKKPIIDYARSRFNFKLCDLRRVEYVTIEETLRECLQRTAKLDYNILEDEDCWLIMFGATIACDHAQRSDDYKADKIESFEFQIHFNNFVENVVPIQFMMEEFEKTRKQINESYCQLKETLTARGWRDFEIRAKSISICVSSALSKYSEAIEDALYKFYLYAEDGMFHCVK